LLLRRLCHSDGQMWQVEYTDEFGEWFEGFNGSEQDSIDRNVYLLEQFGPALPDRYSKPIVTSRFSHMRELRVQHGGEPIRLLYASIRAALRFCSSVAIRPGMTHGTKNSRRERMRSMSNICGAASCPKSKWLWDEIGKRGRTPSKPAFYSIRSLIRRRSSRG
jgi:hypothetical protein